jgi:YegS/Rv2252/BmrU family lipid kinase
MMQRKKITFIANGKKQSIGIGKEILNEFFSSDFDFEIKRTAIHGQAMHLAEEAIQTGTDFLIAIGGDGTTNEVINGFLKSPDNLRENVVVGLIPFGTGNDFSRTLKLKSSVKYLHKLIIENKIKPIDIGEVEYEKFEGGRETRYFNNVSQIGVGAETVRLVNSGKKFLGPALTYFTSTIKAFLTFKHQNIKLISDELKYDGKIVSLCFANGKFIGSGLGIAPHAIVDDGLLSVVIVGNVSVGEFVKYVPSLRKLKFINHPEVQYKTITGCELISNVNQNYPVEMDGEYVGNTPIKVKLHKGKVNFLRE